MSHVMMIENIIAIVQDHGRDHASLEQVGKALNELLHLNIQKEVGNDLGRYL